MNYSITDLSRIGVGEEIHEKMNSSEAEAVFVGRKCVLQLSGVDKAASVLIGHPEALNHVRVSPRRELRRRHQSERVS